MSGSNTSAKAKFDQKTSTPQQNLVRLRADARMIADAIIASKSFYHRTDSTRELGYSRDREMDDIRIGMFSRRVQIQTETKEKEGVSPTANPELFLLGNTRLQDHYRLAIPFSIERIKAAQEEVIKTVTELCEQQPQIIVLNELAYPSFTFPAELINYQTDTPSTGHKLPVLNNEDVEQLKVSNDLFEKSLQKLSNEYSTIIVAGSHHNCETFHNEALMFEPGKKHPVKHNKLLAAKSIHVGEVIRTPSTNEFPVYSTEIGKVSILVCIDVMDMNMFCRKLYSFIYQEVPIDIVVVPSYTGVSLASACKSLSKAANCVVIYVNAANGSEPRRMVYVSGKYIAGNNDGAFDTDSSQSSIVDVDATTRKASYDKAVNWAKGGLIAEVLGTYA